MQTRFRLAAWAAFAACFCIPASAFAAAPAPASSATAADQDPVPHILKRLGQGKHFGGVAVAPDGQHLAWTRSGDDGMRIRIADADGNDIREATFADGDDDCYQGLPTWSPDGSRLAFLGHCGDDGKGQSNIYLLDADTDSPVAERLTDLDGHVQSLTWAPDGDSLGILYVAGDTHAIGATAASKPRVGEIGAGSAQLQRLATVDADTGDVHELTPKSLFVYEYTWAPNSDRVAFIGAEPPGSNNWWKARMYTQDVDAQSPDELVNAWAASGSLHHMQMALPRFSPNGKTIAFIGGLMSDQGITGGDLYRVPASGGDAVNVTPDLDFTPSWFHWTDNKHLLVSSVDSSQSRLDAFTLHGDHAATHDKLLTQDASFSNGRFVSAISIGNGNTRIADIHSDFQHAPEVRSGKLEVDDNGLPQAVAEAPQTITDVNTDLEPLWGKAKRITWQNEGFDVSGWLLYPADYNPDMNYPMIVSVHGGPVWASRPGWPRQGYGPAPLSALGYFVFLPNPRGSMGEGEEYTKAVRRDMGYGDLQDILAGVDKVEDTYPVDDDHLGLTGWSYGGFMSMFAPTQTDRFDAVVAGAGITDWQSYYGQNVIDQWMLPFFGASVYDDPDVYAKSSAINFIKQANAPTLIIAGQFDKETPAPQAFEHWHALRALGVPTKLMVYKGEGHGFHKANDRRDVLQQALDWFRKYLGDKDHPDATD